VFANTGTDKKRASKKKIAAPMAVATRCFTENLNIKIPHFHF
jgi:hypothetical protein